MILRGEVGSRIDQAVEYLYTIRDIVDEAIAEEKPRESFREHDIESCGLSRIPLNGLVQDLHLTNLLALYDREMKGKTVEAG